MVNEELEFLRAVQDAAERFKLDDTHQTAVLLRLVCHIVIANGMGDSDLIETVSEMLGDVRNSRAEIQAQRSARQGLLA